MDDLLSKKYKSQRFVAASAAIFFIYLARPSYLGESYSLPATVVLVVFGVFCSRLRISASNCHLKHLILMLASVIVFWLYLSIHSTLNNVENPYAVFSLTLVVGMATGALLIMSDRETADIIRRKLVLVMSLLGYSALITSILLVYFEADSLFLFNIPSKSYDFTGTGDVYFPLSMSYTWTYNLFGNIPRFNHFWRESGIAQCVYAWAFFMAALDQNLKNKRLLIIGLILGSVTTFSAPAYALMAFQIAIFLLIFYKSKFAFKSLLIFIFTPLILGMMWFSIFSETSGFLAKLQDSSFNDRFLSMTDAIYGMSNNFWGYGIYSESSDSSFSSSINLIGSISYIGVPGFIISIIMFYIFCTAADNKLAKSFAIFPIIFTFIFLQPLLDATAIYFLMLIPTPLIFAKN